MKLRKSDYDKFVAAFSKRYKTQIKQDRKPTEAEMLSLYSVFKSDKYGREICGQNHSRWFEQFEQLA